MQWLVLCGIPYSGSEVCSSVQLFHLIRPYERVPLLWLPTSLDPTYFFRSGQALLRSAFAPRATGRLNCSIHNFLRVPQAALDCKRATLVITAQSQLSKTISESVREQASRAVERGGFLWETTAWGGAPCGVCKRRCCIGTSRISLNRAAERFRDP